MGNLAAFAGSIDRLLVAVAIVPIATIKTDDGNWVLSVAWRKALQQTEKILQRGRERHNMQGKIAGVPCLRQTCLFPGSTILRSALTWLHVRAYVLEVLHNLRSFSTCPIGCAEEQPANPAELIHTTVGSRSGPRRSHGGMSNFSWSIISLLRCL